MHWLTCQTSALKIPTHKPYIFLMVMINCIDLHIRQVQFTLRWPLRPVGLLLFCLNHSFNVGRVFNPLISMFYLCNLSMCSINELFGWGGCRYLCWITVALYVTYDIFKCLKTVSYNYIHLIFYEEMKKSLFSLLSPRFVSSTDTCTVFLIKCYLASN